MNRIAGEMASTVSYLIEHPRGTSELWMRRIDDGDIAVYHPLKLVQISGGGAESLNMEQITQSIALDEWMADHFQVFSEGRTSCD